MKNLKVSILSKTKISLSILLIAFSAITFTSCEDYPEGPAISLISKTNRVANNWRVAQALNDGVDVILKLKEDEMWLKQDGGTTEIHYVTR